MLGSQGALTPGADTKLQDRIRELQEGAKKSNAEKRHTMQLLQRNKKKLENFMPDAGCAAEKNGRRQGRGQKNRSLARATCLPACKSSLKRKECAWIF